MARYAIWLAGALCVVGYLTSVTVHLDWLRLVTQPTMMIWLAAYTLHATPHRHRANAAPLFTGLAFSAAGDAALLFGSSRALLAGIAMFSCTHLCYIYGFLKYGAGRSLRTRRGPLLWYALYSLSAWWLWPQLGSVRLVICAYGALLFSMSVAAAATSRRLGVGAALFVVSDVTIGLGLADHHFPLQDVMIAATYIVGQWIIARNWPQRRET
ncbi:lysoplasmalogenase [Flindersiella endophytica]